MNRNYRVLVGAALGILLFPATVWGQEPEPKPEPPAQPAPQQEPDARKRLRSTLPP